MLEPTSSYVQHAQDWTAMFIGKKQQLIHFSPREQCETCLHMASYGEALHRHLAVHHLGLGTLHFHYVQHQDWIEQGSHRLTNHGKRPNCIGKVLGIRVAHT